jgi:hypothetical protein
MEAMRKLTTPTRNMSRRSNVISSARCGSLRIISRNFSKQPFYTNHTLSKKNLKDCTMIKKLMMLGAFCEGRKPGEDPGRKVATPIPREAEVMTIFD